MATLVQQRCLRHAERQAVARCPECSLFYCRECITEHEDRVLCTDCLRKKSGPALPPGLPRRRHLLHRSRAWLGSLCTVTLALLIGWSCFYLYGRLLLAIPTSFHNGTIWKDLKEEKRR